MTQFDQLKILYNQLFNIAAEVKMLVEKDEYDEAFIMLKHKDELMKKFLSAKKTILLNSDEQKEADMLDKELLEKEQANIDFLVNLKAEVGRELNKTSKNIKLNAAYTTKSENSGGILDFTE